MSSSLKQKVFAGAVWMAAMSGCQQIMSFIVQIILARLLMPHDYGIAALVMTIDCFAVVLSTAGIGTALVQRKEISMSTIDAAAIITSGLAIMLGGALFFASNGISRYYALPEMSFLLRIVAVDIFIKVLISLYDSLLLRELKYKVLSVRTFLGLLVQSLVSISLAVNGLGAKSLVFGYVMGSFVQLVLCISATRYFPRTFGDYKEVKAIFQFGGWILLGRLVNQAAQALDQMFIAKFLNVSDLGLVNVSRRITSVVPNTFLGFAGRVALPVFSRWQDDLNSIEKAYWRGLRINMMIVFPLCLLTGLFSYQMLALLYGAKWLDGECVMKILSVAVAIISIDAGYCSSVINATGNPRYGTIVMMASLFVIPGFVYIGSFWGIVGIAWAGVSYSTIFILINQFVLRYLCGFRISRLPLLMFRAVMSIIPMSIVGYFLISVQAVPRYEVVPAVFSAEWFILAMRLLGCGIISMSVYAITTRFTAKDDFMFLWNGIRDIIRRKK